MNKENATKSIENGIVESLSDLMLQKHLYTEDGRSMTNQGYYLIRTLLRTSISLAKTASERFLSQPKIFPSLLSMVTLMLPHAEPVANCIRFIHTVASYNLN